MYTLDTNAIIYYLKDDPRAAAVLNDIFGQPVSLYVSSVTEIELFAYPKLTTVESNQIEELLETLALIPLDSRIARTAGLVRREYNLELPDAAIAATALFTSSTLVTRNVHDFRKIPSLSIQKI